MDEMKLAALLCSRLCHDLVSPIGALNNGVEVLEEETSVSIRKEAMALLSESARAAIGKLLFFRVAFGAATGFGSEISFREVMQAANGLFANSRIKIDWGTEADLNPNLAKTAAKLLLNLIMVAGEALHRGGTISPKVVVSGDDASIVLTARGQGAQVHEAVQRALKGDLKFDDIEVRTAQPWYAGQIASQCGGTIDVSHLGTETIVFSAKMMIS